MMGGDELPRKVSLPSGEDAAHRPPPDDPRAFDVRLIHVLDRMLLRLRCEDASPTARIGKEPAA